MTTQSAAVEIPVRSSYGAVELKEFIRKYTVRGFLVTVSICVLFFLLYFTFAKIKEAAAAGPKLAPIAKITLDQLPQDAAAEEVAPPIQQIINTGPAARAGTPVPVPDAQITPDMKEFATIDVMSRASSVGGEGVDMGGFSADINLDKEAKVDVKIQDEEPAPDEFVAVEKEPAVDLEKIQSKIVYPELARRAGVEGKVTVRVLVQKTGKISKMLIEQSDSELLNDAALKAIREVAHIPPALQNGQAVSCWVSIPIQFKLR